MEETTYRVDLAWEGGGCGHEAVEMEMMTTMCEQITNEKTGSFQFS